MKKHIFSLEVDLFCDIFRKRDHSIGNSNDISENMVFGEFHFQFWQSNLHQNKPFSEKSNKSWIKYKEELLKSIRRQ